MTSSHAPSTRILVVSTVHHADDTRIRERLIRTLATDHQVVYATAPPGPSDPTGLDWVELRGGRLGRLLRVPGVARRSGAGTVVLHDPELIPVGLVLRLLDRGRRVVFDLHESFPDQIRTKEWIPRLLRPPLAMVAGLLIRVAGRYLEVTLAEEGYQRLVRRPVPVFENHPDTSGWPPPDPAPLRRAVYVGDVTVIRGVLDLVRACVVAEVPLVVVGGLHGDARQALEATSDGVELLGRLPNPAALEVVRGSGVGVSPLRDVPNYRHSHPTKVLEYLACGIPVVATDLPGTRSLVEGLDAVELVPPGVPEAMAEALARMLQPEAGETARAQAVQVRQRFSWPRERVLDFYRT